MESIEIRLPETIADCRPDQLAKWIFLSSGDNDLETLTGKLDFRVQVVSIFSNVSRARLELVDFRQINDMFSHMIEVLASHEDKEPLGVVEIDNKRFVFDKDFAKITTGQIIDLKLIDDLYQNPTQIVSILYVEDGMRYNELDEHDNVLNPMIHRVPLFKKHFPGDEFLNVFGFFLDNYEKRKNAIFALNMAKTQMTMTKLRKELKEQIQEIKTGSTGQQT